MIFTLPWDKREEFLLVLCSQILAMGRFNWCSLEHCRLPSSKYQAQHLLDVKLNGKFNSLRCQTIFCYYTVLCSFRPETKVGQVLILVYLAPSLVGLFIKHNGKISDLSVFSQPVFLAAAKESEQYLCKPELMNTCIFSKPQISWATSKSLEYPCGWCVTAMIFEVQVFLYVCTVATPNTYVCCL